GGTSGGGGGGGGGGETVLRTTRTPAPTPARRTTPTTLDTGYQEALPFRPSSAPPSGDPAVVARLGDEGDGSQRETLLLVAGGTTAFSWAMLLRFVSRRAMVL